MDTYLIVDRDSVKAKVILDTLSLTSTTETFTDSLQLQEENGYWVSNPGRLKREGSIYEVLSIIPYGNWQFRVGREMVWFGNFEDEGCTMWLLDHPDEFYDDSIFYAGARSLCQFRSQNNVTIATHFENRLPCYSDTGRYTLYGYIRTDNANNAEVSVRFYYSRTSGSVLGSETTGAISGTNDWAFYYKNFTPADGTNFIDVWLRSEGPQNGDGYTWFDNVGGIEWEEWQPLTAMNTLVTPYDYHWIQIRTDFETYDAELSYEEKIYYIQTSVNEYGHEKTSSTSLRCFPNPARSVVTFQYYLNEPVSVSLNVYNVLGQKVRTLCTGEHEAGRRAVQWDGCDDHGRKLSAGIYFCRIQAGDSEQSEKLILLK
jgi:hypothetical protein